MSQFPAVFLNNEVAWDIPRLSFSTTIFHSHQQSSRDHRTSASTKLNITQHHASQRLKRANHCRKRRAASQHALSVPATRIPKSHALQRPDLGESRVPALEPDRRLPLHRVLVSLRSSASRATALQCIHYAEWCSAALGPMEEP